MKQRQPVGIHLKFTTLILAFFLTGLPLVGLPAGEEDCSPVDRISDEGAPLEYLQLFEGLHITGNPVDIDINTYRLRVTGAVTTELSLTFDEVKSYDSVDEEIALNCPGYFTDTGIWTGVPIKTLLDEAGISESATTVKFISCDTLYTKSLPIERVMEGDILVSYLFDGNEFHQVHGFPLRIAAPRQLGAVWVKWLGEIRVE